MFDFFTKDSQISVLKKKHSQLLNDAKNLSDTEEGERKNMLAEAKEIARIINELEQQIN